MAGPDEKRHLGWRDVERLVDGLVEQLPVDYDHLLVVTRGGMIPAALVSQLTGMRDILVAAVMFYTGPDDRLQEPLFMQFPEDPLVAGKRILVIDDVWDSGSTSVTVKDRLARAGARPEVAVLHYKPSRSRYQNQRPDYYVEETSDWIIYPWQPKGD
ncbi:MAG TPA: phosphoribosyltransferase family protein [Chloroflexota bacterium]|nr:phosphoribosyltransferase family protein [Chloroflexota bacterium]